MIRQASEILSLVETFREEAARPEEITGTVRLACFRSVATHLLPVALHQLAVEHPRVRLEVDDGCLEARRGGARRTVR